MNIPSRDWIGERFSLDNKEDDGSFKLNHRQEYNLL